MPKRFCTCTGCAACNTTSRTHGILFDLDLTRTLKCPPCQAHATRKRNNPPGRPSAAARGYGAAWRKISQQVTAGKTHCEQCGQPFTKANPATADHIVERARGGTDELSNLRCICRSCNSSRGGRMLKRKR